MDYKWQPIRMLLYSWTLSFAYLLSPRREWVGVEIAVLSGGDENADVVFKKVKSSLDRIAYEDALARARIVSYVQRIFIVRMGLPAARYVHQLRACVLNYDYVLEVSDDLGIASLIVHECTHARIARQGIRPKNEAIHLRIERACIRREIAFLRSVRGADDLLDWAHMRLQERVQKD